MRRHNTHPDTMLALGALGVSMAAIAIGVYILVFHLRDILRFVLHTAETIRLAGL